MRERERFFELRKKKIGLSLRSRMTLLVGLEIFVSFLISFSLSILFYSLFPVIEEKVPFFIPVTLLTVILAVVATRVFSSLLFNPIKELREAMAKVADGDFSVQLQTKSTSREIQEMFAGFNMMTQELSATEILQTDFVSNVSHEFKTPINAIEGYTTLLQGCETLTGEEQEYVEKILFNTNRLSTLVGNILLLSKIENQSIATNKTKFSLDEQIRQSIVALEPEWAKKDIEFDVDLQSVDYVGNESLFHHVWDNVIGNAVKFSPANGMIRIRLYTEGERILCTVEDNGPGLSEEAKKHVFDKFYQADSSHKQAGNGLGLALVKRILSGVNGEITAENRESGGSCFTVIL